MVNDPNAGPFDVNPNGDIQMPEEPTNARKSFGSIAPHLAEITDKVLFGDVWEDKTLSPRDRSLVTITSLISLYRINELPFHLNRAMDVPLTNGVAAPLTKVSYARLHKAIEFQSGSGR